MRLEAFIAELGRSNSDVSTDTRQIFRRLATHLNEIPYWDTDSYVVFHTRVTSQERVACNLHDRNADNGFPPTEARLARILQHTPPLRGKADRIEPAIAV